MALLKPITPPRAQSALRAICREKCENRRAEYDYSKAQRAALLPSEGKTRIHTTHSHESPFIDPLTPTLVRNKAANRGGGACSLPCEAGEGQGGGEARQQTRRLVSAGKARPPPYPPPFAKKLRTGEGGACSLPAKRGRGLGWGPQRLNDPPQHRLGVMQDFIVPKAHHPILLLLLQPARAFRIVFRLCRVTMAITVHLDDQFGLGAKKIHDAGTDRMLPAKLHAQLSPAEMLPELHLGGGHGAAQLPRAQLHGFRGAPVGSCHHEWYFTPTPTGGRGRKDSERGDLRRAIYYRGQYIIDP